jgi:hypothetical protein
VSTIAFSTDPAGAITTLPDLIAEIRDEMDDEGYSLPKIMRAIGRAEAMFNRELRVPEMETELQFTVTSEQTDLPLDFLQMRTIYQEGSPDNPLKSMSPTGLRQLYRGVAGRPCAYALENRRIVIAPVGDAPLTMLYYAKIPPLTESNPSNWLLFEQPDLYLHTVLAILFGKTGDQGRAADNLALSRGLIELANNAGRKARWGGGPLTPKLVQQVPGARI